jgi:hypothetical protein
MTPYAGRRVFRTTRWVIIAVALAESLFLAGTWYQVRSRGLHVVTLLFGGLALFGALGLLDGLTRSIVLEPDALRVNGLWGRRRYPKSEILGIEEAKGVQPALRLKDGSRAKLPADVGRGLGNSVRAWLRADG